MELDVFLLWFSRISLVFWSAVLVWCAGTLILRARKEKQWEAHYIPTLESGIQEYHVGSWTTLSELEALKEQEGAKQRAAKTGKTTRKKKVQLDEDEE